jgi:hypothetical protein
MIDRLELPEVSILVVALFEPFLNGQDFGLANHY